jgi:hypothetical protein
VLKNSIDFVAARVRGKSTAQIDPGSSITMQVRVKALLKSGFRSGRRVFQHNRLAAAVKVSRTNDRSWGERTLKLAGGCGLLPAANRTIASDIMLSRHAPSRRANYLGGSPAAPCSRFDTAASIIS